MTLGVYWTYGFPEGLYEYKYFEFSPAIGGHANNCAELRCTVNVDKPEVLFTQLENLVDLHPGSYVFAYQNGNAVHLGSGGYCMFDFDFAFMSEVEKILVAGDATKTLDFDRRGLEPMRFPKTGLRDSIYRERKLFQTVAGSMGKANAQVFSLRFDCSISNSIKREFISRVKAACIETGFEVFFYTQFIGADHTNLMLFFSMGRQGVKLSPIVEPKETYLEKSILALMEHYDIKKGYFGGYDQYPKSPPTVVLIKDEEYIFPED